MMQGYLGAFILRVSNDAGVHWRFHTNNKLWCQGTLVPPQLVKIDAEALWCFHT